MDLMKYVGFQGWYVCDLYIFLIQMYFVVTSVRPIMISVFKKSTFLKQKSLRMLKESLISG